MYRTLMLIAVSFALASCDAPASVTPTTTTAGLEAHRCGSIVKLHRLGGIYLASQPSMEDFSLAKAQGVKTVINLRNDAELVGTDEKGAVERQGLKYVHIPFNGPPELTDEVFDSVRDQLRRADQPILLHCATANRVGAVWMAHRVLDQGVNIDAALEEAKTIGMRTPGYEQRAREYIAKHAATR